MLILIFSLFYKEFFCSSSFFETWSSLWASLIHRIAAEHPAWGCPCLILHILGLGIFCTREENYSELNDWNSSKWIIIQVKKEMCVLKLSSDIIVNLILYYLAIPANWSLLQSHLLQREELARKACFIFSLARYTFTKNRALGSCFTT